MAVYREIPCKFYIAFQQCETGRKAEHRGYCQHCKKYIPRAHLRRFDRRKEYNEDKNKWKHGQRGYGI